MKKISAFKFIVALLGFSFVLSCARESGEGFAPGGIAPAKTLAILPLSPATSVNHTLTFTAQSGQAPYVFSITSGPGSIDANSGLLTASNISGVTTVRVTDFLGQFAETTLTVNPALSISPTSAVINTNGFQNFFGAGGVTPYIFSIQSGSGTIDANTGFFTAPAAAGAVVVRITDQLGDSATSSVNIVSSLVISPASITLASNGTQTFSVSGGSAPFVYSIVSGGGTINSSSGLFTAPATAGSVVVRVTDSLSNTSDAAITVVSVLTISPTTNILAVNNTFTFVASGGQAPFVYSIVSGGGTINSSSGLYTAPATSGSAVIQVTDSIGQTANSNITINSALAISPGTVTLSPSGTQTFSATGGVSPYVYSIVSGGGTINSSSGLFTASASAGSVVVRVTDSLSNTSTSNVTVVSALTMTPATQTLVVNGTQTFSAVGGSAPFVYSIVSGGGTINSSSGLYTAPATAGSVVVRVTDSLSNTSTSNVTVVSTLTISPTTKTLAVNNTFTFVGSGGQAPYVYSVLSGGGTVNSSSGLYAAPATSGSAVVRVTDSIGQTANSNITINAALVISPATPTLVVSGTQTFTSTGGVSPYVYSIVSGGGTINSTSGLFAAPATAGSVVVRVTDSLSNTSDAAVTVVSALTISPTTKILSVNNTFTFAGSGGQTPYVYSVLSGGGTINSSSGLYTAPATSGSAVVRVTDSIGQTANSNITINAALTISPATQTLAASGTQTFTSTGGVSPYVYSIVSGGGTINSSSGLFTAPATAGSVVVQVTDSLSNTSTSNVTVVSTLAISPTTKTLAVNNTFTFVGLGGQTPFVYSIVSGGGTINSTSGLYTAPATSGSAVVRVMDSIGQTANSNITINAALAISPATVTLALSGTQTFTSTGGVSPYVYSIVSGGGTINSSSGLFTAPATAGSVVVRVTDSLSNTSTSNVTVASALTITPATQTLVVNGTQTFSASGGSAPFVYSIVSGGGTINSSSGLFTAPATAGSVVVRVTDSLSNTSTSNVTVVSALTISPTTKTLAVNNTFTFVGSGGQAPLVYSIVSGGGTINSSSGLYTAPATSGSAVVRVTDSIGQTANSNITINAALVISPATPTLAVNGTQTFSASGGSAPFVYSIVSGGGTINSSSGLFTAPAIAGSVVVRVTDSLSNTSNAAVTVVSALTISPTTKTLAVNNAFTFVGSGGQVPFVYSIVSGGGTINSSSGLYTAPATSGSAVVRVTDSIGQTANSNITINSALVISPTTVTITEANTTTFAASGGVPPSSYSVVSGTGSVNASTGVFTPSGPSVTTVRATDTLGNTSDGVVTVNANLAITPVTANVVTNGSLALNTTGGVSPMTFSIVSGTGIIDSLTGDFAAPATSETDVVRVTDAVGNFADSTLTIYPNLNLSPLSVTLASSATQSFTASGGSGALTFSIVSGGGTINSSSGLYTAPVTAGNAVIRVTDTLSNSLEASITIVSSLTITPLTLKLPVFSTATFSSVLGSAPYTYSVVTGTGSVVAATGVYTGASVIGAGSVRVTDAGFNTSTATVTHIEPVEIVSGSAHSCVRYNDNSVKCWGLGSSGQLGYGSTALLGDGPGEGGDKLLFVNLGTGRSATQLAAGSSHSCALLDNATVKCWGLNSSGQLGLGDTTSRGTTIGQMGDSLPAVNLGVGRTATKIFAFYTTTCALLDNNALKCWGLNSSGQLGLGDTTSRGTTAAQMGDNLLAVNLGTGRRAVKVSGGLNFTCAILDNASVKCWGSATYGQTGHGNTATVGSGAGQMGDSLAVTNLGTGRTAIEVAAGYSHACFVLDNAAVKCIGRNQSGQLGYNNTTSYGLSAGTIGDSLPNVTLGFTPVQVIAGRQWSCAVSSTSTVKCWGLNSLGELLKGSTANLGDGAGEMAALTVINFGTSIVPSKISLGQYFGCAIMTNKRIKCWGSAASGALLNASTTSHLGDAVGEVGDGLVWVNH